MRNHLLTAACLPLCISCQTNAPKQAHRSDGQMVHWSKSDTNCVTTISLLDTLNATNCTELPGGTNLFYFTFDGHRAGKDFYSVGVRYPVGRTNEIAVSRQIEYEGKRLQVPLGEDDTVVVEPRKDAK